MKKETTGVTPTAIDFISGPFIPPDLIIEKKISGAEKTDHSSVIFSSAVKSNKSKRLLLGTAALIVAIGICSVALVAKKRSPAKNEGLIAKTKGFVNNEEEVPSLTKHDQAKKIRKDWWQFITAENSNYAYGVLGGINNLSVIFTNRTDYQLEEVKAKIIYLKANGKPWKTKYISVFNMPPHSERKQSLPKVNRGKSVQITISKIVSKKMNFNYSPDKKKNSDDPYFMEN